MNTSMQNIASSQDEDNPRRWFVAPLVFATLGIGGFVLGGWAIFAGFISIIVGVPLSLAVAWNGKATAAARHRSTVLHLIGRAQLDMAEEALNQWARSDRSRCTGWEVLRFRALIALRRGALPSVIQYASEALDAPAGVFCRDTIEAEIGAVRGMRAVGLAAMGETNAAKSDIIHIRGAEFTRANALAWASLAECVLHSKHGDHEAIRTVLANDELLLMEHMHPRERAIVRAYRRMVDATGKQSYREPAAREKEDNNAATLVDWIATIDPSVSEFSTEIVDKTESPGSSVPGNAIDVTPAVRKELEEKLPLPVPAKRGAMVIGAVWALLLLLPMAFDRLQKPTTDRETARISQTMQTNAMWTIAFPVAFGGILAAAAIFYIRARERRGKRALILAEMAMVRGEKISTTELLEAAKGPNLMQLVPRTLACFAIRRGDFSAALGYCDQAVRNYPQKMRGLPETHWFAATAERAFIMSALGDGDKAMGMIQVLAERYPHAYDWDLPRFRVALVGAARKMEYQEAAKIAAMRSDLDLDPRIEKVADLCVLVGCTNTSVERKTQLAEELARDHATRKWISTVAPALLQTFDDGLSN